MSQKSEVVSIYKPLGKTMGELVDFYRKEMGIAPDVSITYAGRLDPMAEGVALLLVGDMVHRKNEFLSETKEYTFECLWGFETDTYDILGLVAEEDTFEQKDIHSILKNVPSTVHALVGKRIQEYPAYSSKPVQGKPLFMWAKEGRLHDIDIPAHEIEIYSIKVLSERSILGAELEKEITEKISLVHGDFRQADIISAWQKKLAPLLQNTFFITTMHAHVSSGTYIRTLVHEFGKSLGAHATTFHIVRTKIGDFSAE